MHIRFTGEDEQNRAFVNAMRVVLGKTVPLYVYGMEDGEIKLTKPAHVPQPRKPPQPCSVEGCNGMMRARGMCNIHYQRALREKRAVKSSPGSDS